MIALQYCTFAYDSEQAARADYERLTGKLHVTGEIGLARREGRWFLEIASEKDINDALLSKITGSRL